ncbi:DNA adenine methylase [Paenibacillus sp. D2_2]|uniref:DNA adenine methylase n=1 Tax=Paenibacillus sp. D2_2 TaxID=3073092 RepID=UPI002814C3AA|nr:DNA adenine methylase [Paenibacillus sp. D2_2]WMT42267.1 DNA adenine methylase [Paenibacillus sp. D2_2]
MMTFRYIGSKARLVEELAKHIGSPNQTGGMFVDAFCGTGAVAETAMKLGWPVWLNDHMVSAGIISAARLISKNEANFKCFGGYSEALKILNGLEPLHGFIWREYSPASALTAGVERRYFTEENAGRIDAIRSQISLWKKDGQLNRQEEQLLIADLLSATNRVANIAGTYGCFLSKWQSQAFNNLELLQRELNPQPTTVRITCEDVSNLQVNPNDLVYLDPPYTKRQYAAYYHILETIVINDEPEVQGVSGLRPWQMKASDFCYKKRALDALTNLIKKLNSNRILLSYSEEGHVPINQLMDNLSQIGSATPFKLMKVGRYRPNKTASMARSTVSEYLIVIEKDKLSSVREEVI